MSKRFIDTEIFNDVWFMELPNKYKLFWIYLISNCDHTGIWEVNYKVAQFYVGEYLEPIECERHLKDRFVSIENGRYWFFPKFINFQYGNILNYKNKALVKVVDNLISYNLLEYMPNTEIINYDGKPLTSPLQGVKEEEEDKDKDLVKEEEEKEDGSAKNKNIKEWQIKKENYDEIKWNKYLELMAKYSRIQKLQEPLTFEQIMNINEKYKIYDLRLETYLASMHNYKKLLTNSVSANLTLQNWINRDIESGKIQKRDKGIY